MSTIKLINEKLRIQYANKRICHQRSPLDCFKQSCYFFKISRILEKFFQNLGNPGEFPQELKKTTFIDEEYLILLFYMKVHPNLPLWAKN